MPVSKKRKKSKPRVKIKRNRKTKTSSRSEKTETENSRKERCRLAVTTKSRLPNSQTDIEKRKKKQPSQMKKINIQPVPVVTRSMTRSYRKWLHDNQLSEQDIPTNGLLLYPTQYNTQPIMTRSINKRLVYMNMPSQLTSITDASHVMSDISHQLPHSSLMTEDKNPTIVESSSRNSEVCEENKKLWDGVDEDIAELPSCDSEDDENNIEIGTQWLQYEQDPSKIVRDVKSSNPQNHPVSGNNSSTQILFEKYDDIFHKSNLLKNARESKKDCDSWENYQKTNNNDSQRFIETNEDNLQKPYNSSDISLEKIYHLSDSSVVSTHSNATQLSINDGGWNTTQHQKDLELTLKHLWNILHNKDVPGLELEKFKKVG